MSVKLNVKFNVNDDLSPGSRPQRTADILLEHSFIKQDFCQIDYCSNSTSLFLCHLPVHSGIRTSHSGMLYREIENGQLA